MAENSSNWRLTGLAVLAGVLAGCSVSPDGIVASDEALCRYSEAAGGAGYTQCLGKLESQKARVQTASATRVEGYALLQGPALQAPAEVAKDCKQSGEPCSSDDVTGSIPAAPKR